MDTTILTTTGTLGFEPCIAPELLLEQPTAMAPDMAFQSANVAPFSLQDLNTLQLPHIDWPVVNSQMQRPSPAIDPRLVDASAENNKNTVAHERRDTRREPPRRDTSSSGESRDYSRRKKRGSLVSATTAAARAPSAAGRRRSSGSSAGLGPEVQTAGTRERNRIAASKYRKKHGESVNRLQEDEKQARDQHKALVVCVDALRFEILGLKNELLRHGNCDCDEIKGYLKREAAAIGRGYSDKAG